MFKPGDICIMTTGTKKILVKIVDKSKGIFVWYQVEHNDLSCGTITLEKYLQVATPERLLEL